MPTKIEKDLYTGQATTGHEWDGIRELNTPLPRWWLWILYATIAWSIAYFILYPAIPGLSGYTKGVLGYSSRVEIGQKIAAARAAQGKFRDGIRESSLADIRKNDQLLRFALPAARRPSPTTARPATASAAPATKAAIPRSPTTTALGRQAGGHPPDDPLRCARRA